MKPAVTTELAPRLAPARELRCLTVKPAAIRRVHNGGRWAVVFGWLRCPLRPGHTGRCHP